MAHKVCGPLTVIGADLVEAVECGKFTNYRFVQRERERCVSVYVCAIHKYLRVCVCIATLATKQKTEEEKYLIVKYQQSINLRCKARAIKLFEIHTHTHTCTQIQTGSTASIRNVARNKSKIHKSNSNNKEKNECIQKVRNYH